METYMIFMDARETPYLPLTDSKYVDFYTALVGGFFCDPVQPYYKGPK